LFVFQIISNLDKPVEKGGLKASIYSRRPGFEGPEHRQ